MITDQQSFLNACEEYVKARLDEAGITSSMFRTGMRFLLMRIWIGDDSSYGRVCVWRSSYEEHMRKNSQATGQPNTEALDAIVSACMEAWKEIQKRQNTSIT